MKRLMAVLVLGLAVSGLALTLGCAGTDDFEPSDVVLLESFAGPSGPDVLWGVKILNGSSKSVVAGIQVMLMLAGQPPFYTSPVHEEHIGKGRTESFTYREANVAIPAGEVMYQVSASVRAD